jgi:uncharacterized protein
MRLENGRGLWDYYDSRMQEKLLHGVALGVALYNEGHFFEAHEVLEDFWRSLPVDGPSHGHTRLHAQGLVQMAVAFHHESKGNYVGARSVLERAIQNLSGADSSFPDLDLDRLRADAILWRDYLDCSNDLSASGDRVAPALPKIALRR